MRLFLNPVVMSMPVKAPITVMLAPVLLFSVFWPTVVLLLSNLFEDKSFDTIARFTEPVVFLSNADFPKVTLEAHFFVNLTAE